MLVNLIIYNWSYVVKNWNSISSLIHQDVYYWVYHPRRWLHVQWLMLPVIVGQGMSEPFCVCCVPISCGIPLFLSKSPTLIPHVCGAIGFFLGQLPIFHILAQSCTASVTGTLISFASAAYLGTELSTLGIDGKNLGFSWKHVGFYGNKISNRPQIHDSLITNDYNMFKS